MKDLVIIGNENFARLLHYYLREYSGRHIVAFSVNKAYIGEASEFQGLPVVPLEELPNKYSPTEYDIVLGIGYSKMNDIRKALFRQCKEMGYQITSFIHPTAVIEKNVVMGEGNIIFENTVCQAFVRIGSGNLLWDNVTLAHDSSVGDFNFMGGNVGINGFVKVGNNCFFGKHGMIFDHVNIADYTLLGAGGYIKKDTNPYDVILPARSVTLDGRKSTEFL